MLSGFSFQATYCARSRQAWDPILTRISDPGPASWCVNEDKDTGIAGNMQQWGGDPGWGWNACRFLNPNIVTIFTCI